MIKRPAIPWRVVLAVAIRQTDREGYLRCPETGGVILQCDALEGRVERDHNPPLSQRPYDEETGEYHPPANDPAFINLLTKEGHKIRTHKRRGLHRGDQTQLAHDRRLKRKEDTHKAAMAAKAPGKKRRKTGSIPSRGFPKRNK